MGEGGGGAPCNCITVCDVYEHALQDLIPPLETEIATVKVTLYGSVMPPWLPPGKILPLTSSIAGQLSLCDYVLSVKNSWLI